MGQRGGGGAAAEEAAGGVEGEGVRGGRFRHHKSRPCSKSRVLLFTLCVTFTPQTRLSRSRVQLDPVKYQQIIDSITRSLHLLACLNVFSKNIT